MATTMGLYGRPMGLLTDLYQLTMAYGYWKQGLAEREAVFHVTFRTQPFEGGFSIACGLETVIDFVKGFGFAEDDLEYLGTLRGEDGEVLFERGFLAYLRELKITCDVDAVPEGTAVFPYEPLVRVKGPVLQCQLLETALLNMVNFATLVATKAARICLAAQGEPVLEFGLRRAQGMDGAMTASRAAYVGGVAATSNVLAGKMFGIPVKGTHAHSWVMCFESELEAFESYAEAMPNNCVLLVDTYNTLEGVRNAIAVGLQLMAKGKRMVGIRLDSGDLAYLSIEARKMLDEAGLEDAVIVASNDLDEDIIRSLKVQGAKIGVWGVGTKLVTAYDQPALGGVYKLSAIRNAEGEWEWKVKLSEQILKTSVPGILQVRRYRVGGEFRGDMVFDELSPPTPPTAAGAVVMIDPLDDTRRRTMGSGMEAEDLLVPVFRKGQQVYAVPRLAEVRERTREQMASLHAGVKRVVNPHQYAVGLEKGLFELRHRMVLEGRGVEV